MKQGKEVKPNVPLIELAPKYTDVRTEREKKKPCAHTVRKRAHRFLLSASLETLRRLHYVWKVKLIKMRNKNWWIIVRSISKKQNFLSQSEQNTRGHQENIGEKKKSVCSPELD